MNNEKYYEAVLTAIVEFKEIPVESVSLDQRLMRDLNFTSFETITLIGELETKFNTRIPQRKLQKIVTVEDLINILENTKS